MRGRTWVRIVAALGLGLALGSSPERARGGEFYYLMIFGSQSSPKLLRYTQTWATFVRAVGEGPDPSDHAIQATSLACFAPQSAVHPAGRVQEALCVSRRSWFSGTVRIPSTHRWRIRRQATK